MALVMNDTDMKRMLEELCPEGETYTAMAWGTIMAQPRCLHWAL